MEFWVGGQLIGARQLVEADDALDLLDLDEFSLVGDVEGAPPEHFVNERVFERKVVMERRKVEELGDLPDGHEAVEIKVVDVRGEDAVEHAQDGVGKGVGAGGGVADDIEGVDGVVQAGDGVIAEPPP